MEQTSPTQTVQTETTQQPTATPTTISNYAGFWVRFLAVLIDGIIIGFVNGILGFILTAALGDQLGTTLNSIFGLVVSIGYFVFYQASAGQTLGKKALNIKVVDEQGKTPTPFVFFLREIIGKFVSAIIFFIGYFIMLGDAKKQTLHDKIAGTYVIKA